MCTLPWPAKRRSSRAVTLGPIQVGGGAPVSVQSMCTTDTRNATATLEQINGLARLGCDVVRVAVPDQRALQALETICARSPLPVVADVHFDHRLAVGAARRGAAGLRYNPGNIGRAADVERLAQAATDAGIPIRVGVNAGSLPPELQHAQQEVTAEALSRCALDQAQLLERVGFGAIKLSVKTTSVPLTVAAYELCAQRSDYPLHLGITEAGPPLSGAVRTSVALGLLLSRGIGDTIRVSLSADPGDEVWAARHLLQSLDLRHDAVQLVSCPGCGRTTLDVAAMAAAAEQELRQVRRPLSVAVMGCEVNGPGEARQADVALVGSRDDWLLFVQGQRRSRVTQEHALRALLQAVAQLESDAG